MIKRTTLEQDVRQALERNPVAAILGPRQCGKTTLARAIATERDQCEYFDLENPLDVARLTAPLQTLSRLEGLVVIDEIQRKPELFELLRVLVDRPDNPAVFLVLGSASPSLIKGASESLAGRIGFVDMSGFSLDEIGGKNVLPLWNRGGFPRSFLASDDAASFSWRQGFVRTFLERDIPQLGIRIPSETLRRFWLMLAHYHGQIWNAAEFARSLGTSEASARRYLDILCGAYMIRALPPWRENIKKRQVKAPKVYVRDSGLLHALLSVETHRDLEGHIKLGASWEGFAVEEIFRVAHTRDIYFWGTYAGAELDMLVLKHGKRYGIEIKYADAPTSTKSLRIAIRDLQLHRVGIVYPGDSPYDLDSNIRVLPLTHVTDVFAE